MAYTLATVFKDQVLDVETFMSLWGHLTSQDLLQALEARAGQTVHLLVFSASEGGANVEMLLEAASGRGAVDRGEGARWGTWVREGAVLRLALEDGRGQYVLAGESPGASLEWVTA